MQAITVGGGELRLAATPMTPWIYKREFGTDIISELRAMVGEDGRFDSDRVSLVNLVQMAWAMAKTADPKMVDFDAWIGSLPEDGLDFADIDTPTIMAELQRGFFRSAKSEPVEQDEPDAE